MKQFLKAIHGKALPLLAIALLALPLSACGQGGGQEQPLQDNASADTDNGKGSADTSGSGVETEAVAEQADGGRILIAYFTVPMEDGVDTVARASRKESDDGSLGNVRYMANVIQKNVGGDLFAIESADGYPLDDMDALLEAGYNEKADNARPELVSRIENLEDYDVVFVGYPNWNADLPMPLYSFFEEHDFSGKTIIPFMAHGGSGASRTVDTISELEPDAVVVDDPVTVYWDELDDAESIVTEWVQSLDMVK